MSLFHTIHIFSPRPRRHSFPYPAWRAAWRLARTFAWHHAAYCCRAMRQRHDYKPIAASAWQGGLQKKYYYSAHAKAIKNRICDIHTRATRATAFSPSSQSRRAPAPCSTDMAAEMPAEGRNRSTEKTARAPPFTDKSAVQNSRVKYADVMNTVAEITRYAREYARRCAPPTAAEIPDEVMLMSAAAGKQVMSGVSIRGNLARVRASDMLRELARALLRRVMFAASR